MFVYLPNLHSSIRPWVLKKYYVSFILLVSFIGGDNIDLPQINNTSLLKRIEVTLPWALELTNISRDMN